MAVVRCILCGGKCRFARCTQRLRFITREYARGRRMLLVITGKGRGGEGVLKQAVRQWLTREPLSDYVLAVDQAQVKDGGKGAYYILLRRMR
ncbi:MAG TPA: Smr/MutS family protein [Turneriella sp.]|nr:Smr/MutS family protein [Turneriella sp.]